MIDHNKILKFCVKIDFLSQANVPGNQRQKIIFDKLVNNKQLFASFMMRDIKHILEELSHNEILDEMNPYVLDKNELELLCLVEKNHLHKQVIKNMLDIEHDSKDLDDFFCNFNTVVSDIHFEIKKNIKYKTTEI